MFLGVLHVCLWPADFPLFIEYVMEEAEYFFVTFWPITSVLTETDNIWLLYIFYNFFLIVT
jgi:hypothetical protein